MAVVVTGGSGFIGSHLVDELIIRGEEVHIVDNMCVGTYHPDGASHYLLSVTEPSLKSLFESIQPRTVFHLAAQTDVTTSVRHPVLDAQHNVLGTVNVLEAARHTHARVVFTSTGGAIYGECSEPAKEYHKPRPVSPYAASKLAAEEYLNMYNRLYGTSHVTLRLANVYGPRQRASLEGGVVAQFLENEKSVVFGTGKQTRDFIHVFDVVDALLRAANTAPNTYNISTGIETCIADLYAMCRDTFPEYAPARPGEIMRSVLDSGLARTTLGWMPTRKLEDYVALTRQLESV